MSLSRSPSPHRSGGWSSPGLTTPHNGSSRQTSPARSFVSGSPNNVTWATAQAKSAQIRGYPSFSPRPNGFSRHLRKFSDRLPHFNMRNYSDKEKLGRGRWSRAPDWRRSGEVVPFLARLLWKSRLKLIVLIALVLLMVFATNPLLYYYRRAHSFGGGRKFVIMLAANLGGGVMEWKGPREWAIERDSVKNKKKFARRWGYELEIMDMSTKKRYAHEWRESWEKVDAIRNTMRKYPDAEWFWWLDLHTFVMEPSYSLQSHIFNDLKANTYRDINVYNPLNITHPPTESYLDPESLSPVGDGKPDSINLIIPQDCGGFNLGSFFVRRSVWTDRLLDIWWDPVGYEQKHMEWEHKEQDALEYMYTHQPWVRSHVAFIPQRRINSFPPGACGDKGDNPKIHYKAADRDFLVNMAGCEWGRDCWGEMFAYRKLSEKLNRNIFRKAWDWVKDSVCAIFRSTKAERDKPKDADKALEKQSKEKKH